jgi:hypothetical protein
MSVIRENDTPVNAGDAGLQPDEAPPIDWEAYEAAHPLPELGPEPKTIEEWESGDAGDVESDPADWSAWTDAHRYFPTPEEQSWAAAEFERAEVGRENEDLDRRAGESAALDAMCDLIPRDVAARIMAGSPSATATSEPSHHAPPGPGHPRAGRPRFRRRSMGKVPMSKAEAGRLGGLKTVALYGREHMARIGALGFAKVATFTRGGRKAALGKLAAAGKLSPHHFAGDRQYDEAAAALYAAAGLD